MKIAVIFVAMALTVLAGAPLARAQSGKACMDACLNDLRAKGQLNKYPRGYCRGKCNYYRGAPADVLRSSGRINANQEACLTSCRTEMRAKPGFSQNPANRRYCKDKCGVR